MNTKTDTTTTTTEISTGELIGRQLFSTVVWGHVGIAIAFLALAVLSATHQHVGLIHLASGITHIG
jgi:hypothetical protein